MAITLPSLPYAQDALAPHISAQTLYFHHDKHHRAYVDKTNEAIDGTPRDMMALNEIVRWAKAHDEKLFDNAAQAWNHAFLWPSLSPSGGGAAKGALGAAIARDFGSAKAFADAFAEQAAAHFGSGWIWLVADSGKLRLLTTPDAATPLTEPGQTALLTLDLWEHAYYLDYQNARPDYIAAFLKALVNWEFAAANYANAV